MADMGGAPGPDSASGGPKGVPEWDQNQDGVPDVLDDPQTRAELMRKYGYTEADLRTKAKRDLFFEAVRKDYSRKEAKQSYNDVYKNDEASIPDIIDKSGFTMALLQAYPELRDVFRKLSDLLARGKITEDQNSLYTKFKELIDSTAFGKRTDTEIAADLDRYQKGNQANWDRRVKDVRTYLSEYITGKTGQTIDDASATQIALEIIYAGEDGTGGSVSRDVLDRRVRAWMDANPAKPGETGTVDYGGAYGTAQDSLTQWATSNGLTITQNEMDNWLKKIDTGAETLDSVKQWYRDHRLAVQYSSYADEFAKGMDLTDVASGYMSSMSRLLEKPMSSIELSDPTLQRALQGTDENGKPKKMSGWEFEKLLRDTPEWQQTNNAMSVYTDMGESILRSFGFRG